MEKIYSAYKYDMEPLKTAYLYNRHDPQNPVPLSFPTYKADVQRCMQQISVDGVECKTYAIVSYSSPILSLQQILPVANPTIDELNYLTVLLKDKDPELLEHSFWIDDFFHDEAENGGERLINMALNLPVFIPGATDYEKLGVYVFEHEEKQDFKRAVLKLMRYFGPGLETFEVTEQVERLIIDSLNFEKMGKEYDYQLGGFSGFDSYGYSCDPVEIDTNTHVYDEYRVFAYPEHAQQQEKANQRPAGRRNKATEPER